MIQSLEVAASELVVIPVKAQTNKISFPQNATTIEKGRIVAIEAYNVSLLGKVIPLTPVVNNVAFANSFLTLRNAETKTEDYHQVPLTDLLRNSNSGVMERIKSMKVDVSLSYIETADPSTLVIGEAFVLRFVYEPDTAVGCKD